LRVLQKLKNDSDKKPLIEYSTREVVIPELLEHVESLESDNDWRELTN